ncbi:MAG: AMP-binding protein [Myxococcales bacterium]|nr:AMP-binding protein [Myxococcales bacterium]
MHPNIAAALAHIAQKHPEMLAVAVPQGRDQDGHIRYERWSYAKLDAISDQLALGLRRAGFPTGMHTVLMVPPSLDFFALVFAMFKAGLVPVVVDPGMGLKSLKTCLQEARPEGFIGIPKAHAARIALGWGKETLRHFVHVGKKVGFAGQTLDQIALFGEGASPQLHLPTEEETAAVLFTSGSTGIPKGAVYTHGNFQAQIKTIRETYHIEPGERDLCTFPLFALFAPALGMSAYIPEMDASRPAKADARKIIQAIQEQEITNLFGSPALLRVLARYTQPNKTKLPSLRRVISAGAPMPPSLLEAFQPALGEDVEVFPGYGATEAMPLCTIGSHTTLKETRFATEQGKGVCVGSPCVDVTLRIIPIRDEPITSWSDDLALPVGQIGEIVVKGPMATRQYLHNPKGTELAKIPDGDSFWHRMGDLGYLDEQGRVWFCGRKAHRIETKKGPMFTIPCETIFQGHPQVFRAALVGLGQRPSQTPVICIEPHDSNDTHGDRWFALEAELKQLALQHEQTKDIRIFLPNKSFPVDIRHNSKIFREKLTIWADSLLGPWTH